MRFGFGVGGLPNTLYTFVSLFGSRDGNLVPRWDKGSFYILELVTQVKEGWWREISLCVYVSFLLLNKQLGGH